MRSFRRIAVYCASSNSVDEVYFEAARATGRLLAERGIAVVFGGGRVGLMGALADAALEAGGEVIGIIPTKLQDLELGHTDCTELYVVDSMHARKTMMAQLADGYMALPGGYGTLEELFEVTTWTQLNFHVKPVGVLNVAGYYDLLLAFIQQSADKGFIRPLHRSLITTAETPEALLEALSVAEIPDIKRWIPAPPRSLA